MINWDAVAQENEPRPEGLPIVTRRELDRIHCPNPGCSCTIMITAPSCHPEAGFVLIYDRADGVQWAACMVCGLPHPGVQVAIDRPIAYQPGQN